jgi:hypothetical protein
MSLDTPRLCSEVADGVTCRVLFGVRLFREPDAGNPPVRFDEREEETEPSQTGLRRRGESLANRHRKATVTAPLLDSTHPMREDVKQKHFSTLSVRPRSVIASRPLLLRGEDFGFNAWSATEYDRDTDRSCWSPLCGFMPRSRPHSLRSCASQPLA